MENNYEPIENMAGAQEMLQSYKYGDGKDFTVKELFDHLFGTYCGRYCVSPELDGIYQFSSFSVDPKDETVTVHIKHHHDEKMESRHCVLKPWHWTGRWRDEQHVKDFTPLQSGIPIEVAKITLERLKRERQNLIYQYRDEKRSFGKKYEFENMLYKNGKWVFDTK